MAVTFLSRAQWGAGGLDSGRQAPHAQFVGLVAHHTVSAMSDYDGDGFIHGDLDDIKRYMRWLQQARPDLGPRSRTASWSSRGRSRTIAWSPRAGGSG